MDRQKIIPTFITKNSMFISFSDNGRDNEKVRITIFGKLPEGNLRVLGCIGSLSKTHTGVTAHLWTASGCPASENGIGNKKTATAHGRHQMPVKLHSSLCVFL